MEETSKQTSMGEKRHEQWRKKMVECKICGEQMQNTSLQQHMQRIHAKAERKYICRETQDTEEEYYVDFQKGAYNNVQLQIVREGGEINLACTAILIYDTQTQTS